ncbi:hypothetical protein Tco_1355321 [Tanacetum coccineum]
MPDNALLPTVEESAREQEISDEADEHEISDEADEHEISLEHDINAEYLTEAYLQQLLQDEQALRETLEDEANHEKEWKARMKEEEAHDELFMMEFVTPYKGGTARCNILINITQDDR